MRVLLLLFLITAVPKTNASYGAEEVSLVQELNYDTASTRKPLTFSEEKISSYKKDPAFDYLEEESPVNWWTKFKRYVSLQYHSFLEWLFGDYTASGFFLFLVQSIPYLIIGAVLFLGVWLFKRMNPAAVFLAEPQSPKVFLTKEEEIVRNGNISTLIAKALEEKNYRLAIRYNYLLVLQQLEESGHIFYKVSKTDEDYVREIKKDSLQRHFKQLIKIYDFIWYGNLEISEKHYFRNEEEFKKAQELIEQGNEHNL